MAHLIDKDVVVAEIERIRTYYERLQMIKQVYNSNIDNCNDLLDFLDTLEVKGVNLEKEIADIYEANYKKYLTYEEFVDIAKYFFELGLKAKKL